MAVYLTRENFEKTVLNSEKPVLVDFFAPWCGPCRMMAPVIDRFAEEYSGKYVVAKVNIDEETDLAVRFGIMSVPSVLIFKGGKVSASSVGFASEDELLDMLIKN